LPKKRVCIWKLLGRGSLIGTSLARLFGICNPEPR
jgi:hypothetical protein